MLLRFFGLNEDPFGVTPEPRFLYYSHTHREALASLKYGLQTNRGFTTLIAAPGLGKTTLLYRFLNDIRAFARSAFLFDIDGESSPRELVGAILRDLGIQPDTTAAGMHDQLNRLLAEEARAGRKVVIVVDEAQNLSESALEMIRLLSNFETPRAKLLHIILAGQLQLLDKLTEPSLVQLRQRITTFCRIDPLSTQETSDYIRHRLCVAGYGGEELFTDEALDMIADASRGIPRTINNLCFNSLSICRALNRKQVTESMVDEVIADLHLAATPKPALIFPSHASERPVLTSFEERTSRGSRRHTIAAVAALCASILAMIGFAEIRSHQLRVLPVTESAHPQILPVSAPNSDEEKPIQLQPAADPQPAADLQAQTSAPAAANAPAPQPFKVRVARHQTLRQVALQYLGEFNKERWLQIRALNPSLQDPDYVLAGQSIWLPGPPRSNLAQSELTSPSPRSLP